MFSKKSLALAFTLVVLTLTLTLLLASTAIAQEIVVANSNNNTVADIVVNGNKTTTIALTQNPWGVVVTKDGTHAYVTTYTGYAVNDINLGANPPAVATTIPLTGATHALPAINDADTRLSVGNGTHVAIIDITKNADGSRKDLSVGDIDVLATTGLDGEVTSTAYFFDASTGKETLAVSIGSGSTAASGLAFYNVTSSTPLLTGFLTFSNGPAQRVVFTSDGMAWIGFTGVVSLPGGLLGNVLSVDPATLGVRFAYNGNNDVISDLASSGTLAYAIEVSGGNLDTFDSSLNPPALVDTLVLPLTSAGANANPEGLATGSNHIFVTDTTNDRIIDVGGGKNPRTISLPVGSNPRGIDVRPKVKGKK